MERKRFSVLFFIKRSKLLKNGEAPVRVRVTYDRLYVELQLKRSVKVPLWSQEKEKSTGIVAYLNVKEPFKGFTQIHQIGRFAVLIDDIFRDEQTADNFHDVDKGCFVC